MAKATPKPPALPTCGTCPFTVAGDGDLVWCHGGPPSARSTPTGTGGSIVQSFRPLLAQDATGCGLHPKWPRR